MHLCGYSLGGRLALGLLIRHPDLFAAATIIGANPGLSSEAERRARVLEDEKWAQLIETHGVEAFAERWAAQPLFASQRGLPPDVLGAQEEERRRHDPARLASAMRALGLGAMPSYVDALTRIRANVRYVAGELDTKFVALGRTMASRTPDATFDVVPGAGHNVVLESPEVLAACLRAATRG